MSTLRQFRLDLAFIGVTGVTEDGFFVADIAEAEIKTELLTRAQRAVIPMDHSKIGLSDFVSISALPGVQTVITDRSDTELERWLGEANVELLVADGATTGTGLRAVTADHKAAR